MVSAGTVYCAGRIQAGRAIRPCGGPTGIAAPVPAKGRSRDHIAPGWRGVEGVWGAFDRMMARRDMSLAAG